MQLSFMLMTEGNGFPDISLLRGEWWEKPEKGFFFLEEMREGRITEAEAPAVASQITAYIRETPGVRDAENARFTVSGRRFSYSCTVRTEEGSTEVSDEGKL